jgi:hypothetical protein
MPEEGATRAEYEQKESSEAAVLRIGSVNFISYLDNRNK